MQTPKSFYRNIMRLKDSGAFSKMSGLAIGRFTDESHVSAKHIAYIISETVPAGLPVVSGLAFGYADSVFTIPYGRTVERGPATTDHSIRFKRAIQ